MLFSMSVFGQGTSVFNFDKEADGRQFLLLPGNNNNDDFILWNQTEVRSAPIDGQPTPSPSKYIYANYYQGIQSKYHPIATYSLYIAIPKASGANPVRLEIEIDRRPPLEYLLPIQAGEAIQDP